MGHRPRAAVFLGPTLTHGEARELLEADYYPPARKGDVYRVMTSGVEVIVLIDGVFHNTPSVWQKELLDAVEEGFAVYGASSMGALRAAELHTLGMEGRGVVFEWYRSGVIEGDDEVALLHASEEFGYKSLSEPLVNLRYTLARAADEGLLGRELEREIVTHLKRLHYAERTFGALLQSPALGDQTPDARARLEEYVATRRVDIKRRDAVELLQHVKGVLADGGPAAVERRAAAASGSTARQQYDRALLTGFHTPGGVVTGAQLLEHASGDCFAERLRPRLVRRRFVREWMRQNQMSGPEQAREDDLAAFARRRAIDDLPAWLRENGLTRAALAALLAETAHVNRIVSEGPARLGAPAGADGPSDDAHENQFPWDSKLPDGAEDGARAGDGEGWRFVASWARQNGVAPPDAPAADDFSLAEWVCAKGPEYFGLEWKFEVELMRVLQLTGRAGRLARSLAPHASGRNATRA